MKATFPYFESGLPLRSRDLNAIYARADEDIRHSRTCLHGMGIFYGLNPSLVLVPNGVQIVIKKGVGITSQGYLFCPNQNITLSQISKTKIKIDVNRFSKDPFTVYLEQKETATGASSTIDVEELFIGSEVPKEMKDRVRTLTSADLIDKAVLDADPDIHNKRLVVFFQVNKTQAEGCATCDKGVLADLEIKYLLISGLELSKLNLDCTIDETNTPVNFTPSMPPLSMSRLGLSGACISLEDWQPTSYEAINDTAIPTIASELEKVVTAFANVFANTEGGVALNKFKNLQGKKINGQYIHDYLRIVIRAYNEFVSAPFTKYFAALPPETCFPKHLILGHFFEKRANGTAASIGLDDKTKRTPLYRPPFDDATEPDFAYAKKLYERLISLLKNHKLDTALATDLKITPSRRPSHPLSTQAIPFYLDAAEMRETWRLNSFYNATIPHYGMPPLSMQPAFDEADFYRIEGHIGLDLTTVDGIDPVKSLRDCQSLSFQIKYLSSGREVNDNELQTLAAFAMDNRGLEHQGGVPSGGTFVILVDDNSKIVADFCLPYWVEEKVVIPPQIVANFTVKPVPNVPNRYEFDATISVNATSYMWYVDNREVPSAEITAEGKVFTHSFALTDTEQLRNFFVKLEAFGADGRKDVEMTTIVVQRPIQIPDQVVAAISLVRNPLRENINNGETIELDSKDSKFAQEFEWFIEGNSKGKTPKLSFDFKYDNANQTSKQFLVKLLARNSATKREDFEEIMITIERQFQRNQEFVPVALFSLQKKRQPVLEEGKQIGESLFFNNESVNPDGTTYIWLPLEADGVTAWGTATPNDEKEYMQSFEFDNGEQLTKNYVMQLIATLGTHSSTLKLPVTIQRLQGIIEGDEPIPEDVNRAFLLDEAAQKTPPSVVEQAAATKALRSRQKDYRTALEHAAAAETNDKLDNKIYAALAFMGGFQHDVNKLEEQIEPWQAALEAALPSKKTGKFGATQQAIVQNLILFLFDKLTDLQPEGISEKVATVLNSVFDKLKSYNNLNISDLASQWKAENIRTDANGKTIEQLYGQLGIRNYV